MTATLDIVLKRPSKVYHQGEVIAGVVCVNGIDGEVRHEGLALWLEGCVTLSGGPRPGGAGGGGIRDAFTTTAKPISLISTLVELAPAGRIPSGLTEIPFEVPLVPRSPLPTLPSLPETYHGVFINVTYVLRATMKRSFLTKPLNALCQLFVQYPVQERAPCKPVRCSFSAGSPPTAPSPTLSPSPARCEPRAHITAELTSTVCPLDKPITGNLVVESCPVAIKSIELQLVRVETCGGGGGGDSHTRDATEIQNIQVGEGDVIRGRTIPLYMVLPRLFTCPTTTTHYFKIEFELNVAVIFEDDHLLTENFPILLVRAG